MSIPYDSICTKAIRYVSGKLARLLGELPKKVFFGRALTHLSAGSLVFFPLQLTRFGCGLAGIIAFKKNNETIPSLSDMDAWIDQALACDYKPDGASRDSLRQTYLGGESLLNNIFGGVSSCKTDAAFCHWFNSPDSLHWLKNTALRIDKAVTSELGKLRSHLGSLTPHETEIISTRIDRLKDISWCLEREISQNIDRITDLIPNSNGSSHKALAVPVLRKINAVLNSIDRLEVRGRDSAGISLMFVLDAAVYAEFKSLVEARGLTQDLSARIGSKTLTNRTVQIHQNGTGDSATFTITMVYKVAAEIGRLGDNVRFIRTQIKEDPILHLLSGLPHLFHTVSSHTRWASVGAITEPNCHPVDNQVAAGAIPDKGIIHVCLNGDIDNYLTLKKELEQKGVKAHEEITSDTKIIPLQIESHLADTANVAEAFRLALNDFEGSHAIAMHSDLAPGKLFLAQRGSGQAIFVGLARDHYMAVSEVYGFVEETDQFLKLDGEKEIQGKNGPVKGQIFILDQTSSGGLEGISACYYDGTPIPLTQEMVKKTHITSRDIDRQGFPHYFLKEISESPQSVEKTLQGRWRINPEAGGLLEITLPLESVPDRIRSAVTRNQIRRIYFIGQGTAGIAAQACADLTTYFLNDPSVQVNAMKASELSGFKLENDSGNQSLSDTLVVAISQSGTTTDTNRTVDMVKERGAATLAIVNRRDSDLTFKVDGVLYTSSGRDIEMSVASTKAFYSQIVAGAVLGLFLAQISKRREPIFVSSQIEALVQLPEAMRKVLDLKETIAASAQDLAPKRVYWAAVGSGPNKAAADEIRIKLSELCYKTISSDFVEDKKHIDLSAEPLIIVCAAGTGGTVIGDIIKDTAIFKAHKAAPVVIADEGESRFSLYAEHVIHVPAISSHLAPVLNTLAGHLWGYYAALAINEGSKFLFEFQVKLSTLMDSFTEKGLDIYEIFLEKSFREAIALFYQEFHEKRVRGELPASMGIDIAADLTLLCKYLTGRLPVSDFELDFSKKGTAKNMLDTFYGVLGRAINTMARPVDAIKHQAKTVTVGTSRIRDKIEGLLFNIIESHGIQASNLTPQNILVLRNLQIVVGGIEGSILYKVDGLTLLGELTDNTTIRIVEKRGVLAAIPSRVEADNSLKGTKRIIVRQGNVYIGKGRKDDRNILIIPVLSAETGERPVISHLLLVNIAFAQTISLSDKIKALGGKGEHIKNLVQENSVVWREEFLDLVPADMLFGRSAEKVAEEILKKRQ
jgi:glutamine---fructose-6-phosphate transaminase (isomerizing)